MDTPSVLNTHGLPFGIDRMAYQGHFVGMLEGVNDSLFTADHGTPVLDTHGTGIRAAQMPLSLDLVGFE